jgi:Mlc titration factor MtfA (ptsG expression regulator)
MLHLAIVLSCLWLIRELYRSRYHFISLPGGAAAADILIDKVPYFVGLSPKQRKRFVFRVEQVRSEKRFFAMEDLVLTEEHEVLISAMLVMVTFGYKSYYTLPSYEIIRVYPGTFYSRLVDAEVKGLTISNIGVMMSWNDVYEGIEDPDNKINLAIHEFAHAFKLQFSHFHFNFKWEFWYLHAEEVMEEMRTSESHFFRAYGANNINEFWAVACEVFFEQPKEFYAQYPRLYKATARLLKQDARRMMAHHSMN